MPMLRILLTVTLARAALAADYPCEAPPEPARLIRAWRTTYDDMRLDRNQRIAPLRAALAKYSDDLFLHRRYQDLYTNYMEQPQWLQVIAEYRKRAEAPPDNPVRQYLLARILWGQSTAESLALIDRVIGKAPELPWAYLTKARVHQHAKFSDREKTSRAVQKFFELCPASLDSEPYNFVRELPSETRLALSGALRERIGTAEEMQALEMLPTLWKLEFERPPEEHAEIRQRVARDLERIRKIDDPGLLVILREGYEITGDSAGGAWTREQMNKRMPHSVRTENALRGRWLSDRRRPNQEDTRERVEGYYRELLEATGEWIRQWPLSAGAWGQRFRALTELPGEPAEKLLEAGEGLLRAERIGDNDHFVVPGLMVAEAWLNRGTGADRVAELFRRQKEESEARLAADLRADWLPSSLLDSGRRENSETYWQGQWLLVRAGMQKGDREQVARTLAGMEGALAGADPKDDGLFWRTRLYMAKAYLEAGRKDGAAKMMAEMRGWLDVHKPVEAASDRDRRRYAERESSYAEQAGRLAEVEGRTKEAVEAYQNALRLRPFWDTLAGRFQFIERTHALWVESGRSEGDWEDWLARGSKTIETASGWAGAERRLPEFDLVDMQGKKWKLADLKGKRTFVNFWATWCGPCIAELPWVEKLHARLKDRENVQVVTINADDNRALVEPFLRQRGLTFAVLPARDFVIETLRVTGFPTSWIVDAEGVVRNEQAAFTAEPARWLEDVLEKLKPRSAPK